MANQFLTVAETASILEVTPDAVRKLLASEELAGTKRGRDWAVDPTAVERRRRRRPSTGRPLSADTSWGVILESSAVPSASARTERARARGHQWLATHDLAISAPSLRNRAKLERFDIHPSQVIKLLETCVAVTGISAGESVGLAGGPSGTAEVYALGRFRSLLIRELGLIPGAGAATISWIDGEHTDAAAALKEAGSPNPPIAPRTAVLLDLLESDDPRARREAARALSR